MCRSFGNDCTSALQKWRPERCSATEADNIVAMLSRIRASVALCEQFLPRAAYVRVGLSNRFYKSVVVVVVSVIKKLQTSYSTILGA